MDKFTVELTQLHDEIRGHIIFPEDKVFTLECIAEIIRTFSESTNVPTHEIFIDLAKLIK